VVGLGFVHNTYSGDVSDKDDGASGLFGIEYDLSPMFRLRVDAFTDYMPGSAVAGGRDVWNTSFQVGVSYRLVNPAGQ
jgi:hypothetical protein